MKTATVDQVGSDFSTVLKWVEKGENVQILLEGKPVAMISPVERRFSHPDYQARLKTVFGDKVLSAESSEAIRDFNRGER